MKQRYTIAVAALAWAAVLEPAFAQQASLFHNRNKVDDRATITSSIVIQMPLDADKSSEDQQQAALKSFYKMVSGACTLVTESLATNCEVVQVTSRTSVSDRRPEGPRLVLTGQIRMRAAIKPVKTAD